MRRAALIVNILSIVKFAIEGISMASVHRYARLEETQQVYDELVDAEKALRGVTALILVGNAVSLYAMYGAFFYRLIPIAIQMVFTAVYWLVYNLLVARASGVIVVLYHGWENWIVSLLTSLLFIYPHIVLFLELRSGIMTPETYPREKQSCCCAV